MADVGAVEGLLVGGTLGAMVGDRVGRAVDVEGGVLVGMDGKLVGAEVGHSPQTPWSSASCTRSICNLTKSGSSRVRHSISIW